MDSAHEKWSRERPAADASAGGRPACGVGVRPTRAPRGTRPDRSRARRTRPAAAPRRARKPPSRTAGISALNTTRMAPARSSVRCVPVPSTRPATPPSRSCARPSSGSTRRRDDRARARASCRAASPARHSRRIRAVGPPDAAGTFPDHPRTPIAERRHARVPNKPVRTRTAQPAQGEAQRPSGIPGARGSSTASRAGCFGRRRPRLPCARAARPVREALRRHEAFEAVSQCS